MKIRFSIGDFTTKWQRLEKGIMAGSTKSVVLFLAAMNLNSIQFRETRWMFISTKFNRGGRFLKTKCIAPSLCTPRFELSWKSNKKYLTSKTDLEK